jgi:hypothetical protein
VFLPLDEVPHPGKFRAWGKVGKAAIEKPE